MVPLSVCVPTFNNAETIDRALDSVSSLADEIVVLDSNSTDGTREIVNRYEQAVIYDYKFEGFSDMFRTAAEKATHEWVLFVDADEEVRSPLRKEIRDVLQSPDEDAYLTTKKNRMWGQWMHAEHKLRPILGRVSALSWDDNLVGEEWSVRDGYTSRKLENPIHHYAYDSIDEYLEKWQRYTSAEALDEIHAGRSPSLPRYYLKGFAAMWYRYLWERSILDGWQGLFFSTMSAIFFVVVDAKMRQLEKEIDQRENWEQWWIDKKC